MTHAAARLDPALEIADIDRRLFGGFVEHLGRHIYDGIFEPGHPSADADGFRADVIELVKELGVTTIRYPGGNFVSGYRWEDGIGPVDQRPTRLDLAWHVTETNAVGLHEFQSWLDRVGSELMLAVNLGTRGTEEALDLLEYANTSVDTTRTRERAANGRSAPFGVKMWCLGNEMDGPWQLGHRSAADYGKLASRTAKGMRQLDPTIELVVCGSSSRTMPTFGSWEREVLEHTFDDVDFISCHAYYEEHDGDAQEFLASGVDMAKFIASVVATADHVAAVKQSDKRIMLSFDEWNVWYLSRWKEEEATYRPNEWPIAPRQLEDRYSALDAVVFGDLLITLLQHADRVRSASLAQLVNVIAPIMTEPGGPAWRQTTFHPFSLTSRLAQGRAVRLPVDAATFESARFGAVPSVNAVATLDDDGASVFLVNRSTTDAASVRLDLAPLVAALGRDVAVVESHLLHEDDLYAANTLEDRERVGVCPLDDIAIEESALSLELPPVSWAALRLA
ncbi:alpha-N-arabinofuranosidase [Microbacterium sp. CFH 31415]|uniref:arabinosylfuranosidase ArfA n=1 Tax=Microbacterium sp. CFH 31415 TaxID=2921732 RepID=UPI001F12C85A|nr:alpha-N-arabinofuranosidase [Microbacterium sp. CFH 31415]MCH6231531.1 alpha-N-arabinofuranosidase [Microbacterium sp. CFH 31415]